MAKRQISQATFDECVQENVAEFDMAVEEAVADAVQQFESQGVDLSNIIKHRQSGDSGEDGTSEARDPLKQLVDAINALQQLADAGDVENKQDDVMKWLGELQALFDEVSETKVVAGRHNAVEVLLMLLAASSAAIVQQASVLLVAMCASSMDNQDFIGDDGMHRLVEQLSNNEVLPDILAVVKAACVKHETNKSRFSKAGGLQVVLDTLLPAARLDDALSKQVASVFRVLTINDDPNATFSQAHEAIKQLVANDVIAYIIDTLKVNESKPDMLAAWLVVLKQVAITEETCKKIHELTGLELVHELMTTHEQNLVVVKRCITVYRNVAAADELKELIIRSGGADRILIGMRLHHGDASLQQHACATLAALALRSPDNSVKLVDLGAPRDIARAMTLHRSNIPMLRQASLAIRNLVARNVDLRPRVLEESAIEPLLRDAQQYRGCGDEAYAALRDLGCDIQLSTFGSSAQAAKARFNPVQVESSKLLQSVDEAAEAPFAL